VSSPVAVKRQAVDHEQTAQQVEQLAFVPDDVGTAQPERVIEVAVDALGVVAFVACDRERWLARMALGRKRAIGK